MAGLLLLAMLSPFFSPARAQQAVEGGDRYTITSGPSGAAANGVIWLMLDRQTGKTWQLVCGAGAPGQPAPAPGACSLEWQPIVHSARTPPARTPP